MIESIEDPVSSMHRLLGKKLSKYFEREDHKLVASGTDDDGLKAEVGLTLGPRGWSIHLSRQRDRHYDALVVEDIWPISADRSAPVKLQDYLDAHHIELTSREKE